MDRLIRRNILGFPVAVATVDEAAQTLGALAQDLASPYGVSAADVHVITRALEDPAYRKVLKGMDLICPDGMPLVKLLNRGIGPGDKAARRVSGPDLMGAMLGLDAGPGGLRHFLLGGTEQTLALLQQNIRDTYPSCDVAGVYSPPFEAWDDAQYRHMADLIRESGANVVWIGLGCPKQECWIDRCRELLPPAVYLAVGAAFDFHAGTVRRAPRWMQEASLEWLYRLYREPRRLWKRYLKYNLLFLYYLLTGKRAD